MRDTLEQIKASALEALEAAADGTALDTLRVKYLGKKGELTALLKQMGALSAEDRPIIGQLANDVREALTQKLEAQKKKLEEAALDLRLSRETLDVTIPGKAPRLGHQHPMYVVLNEMKEIFVGMGFESLDGPEIELAEYNFDKLNAEEGHPSRDWSDTFYFDKDSRVMLRSQTSPMQVRAMETRPLPIRIISPGRVYRKDEVDATHSP
ncbi:MAG: Phenylalanyl-tRNA synthetase alpha chain, partial [Firmicutes bacterium]|nr:Phenylalanyl-tRNA synthetase alpha chain [Bacillota bacterium]